MAATYQPPQWLVPNMGPGNVNKVGDYSFQFDGTADYVATGFTGEVHSCSFWFKPDAEINTSSGFGCFIGFEDGSPYGGIYFGSVVTGITDELITVYGTGISGVKSYYSQTGGTISADWHHLVISWTGTQYDIYLDNVNKFTANHPALSNIDVIDATRCDIGVRILGGLISGAFPGLISEVCIFDYELSADNVTTLYGDATNGVGNPMGLASPPVAYYKGDRAGFGDQWAVPNQVNYDQVLEFDGSTSCIDLGNSSTLNPTVALSVSTWVKRTGAGTGAFPTIYRSSGNAGGTTGYILTTYSDKIRFYIWDGSWKYAEANAVIINDQWYNLIGVWNGSTVSLYIDGILQTTTGSGSSIIYDTTNDAFIGRYPHSSGSNDYFEGEISNVAIWDTDQSGNKDTIYNNGTPGNLTSLSPTAWWKLDQSTSAWNGTSWDFQNSAIQ